VKILNFLRINKIKELLNSIEEVKFYKNCSTGKVKFLLKSDSADIKREQSLNRIDKAKFFPLIEFLKNTQLGIFEPNNNEELEEVLNAEECFEQYSKPNNNEEFEEVLNTEEWFGQFSINNNTNINLPNLHLVCNDGNVLFPQFNEGFEKLNVTNLELDLSESKFSYEQTKQLIEKLSSYISVENLKVYFSENILNYTKKKTRGKQFYLGIYKQNNDDFLFSSIFTDTAGKLEMCFKHSCYFDHNNIKFFNQFENFNGDELTIRIIDDLGFYFNDFNSLIYTMLSKFNNFESVKKLNLVALSDPKAEGEFTLKSEEMYKLFRAKSTINIMVNKREFNEKDVDLKFKTGQSNLDTGLITRTSKDSGVPDCKLCVITNNHKEKDV
jgi:hypothetical protein